MLIQKPHVIRGFDAPENIKRMRWYFHEYDPDDKPSVPHGHSYEGNYKLNPWTGEVYEVINKKLIFRGKAKDKELATLLENEDFIQFAQKEKEWYKQEYPYKQTKMLFQHQKSVSPDELMKRRRSFGNTEISVDFSPLMAKFRYRRRFKWIPKK